MENPVRSPDGNKYDLRAPALFLDPHPLFHEMRREEPVYFSEALDAWVLTGYKEICSMLRDDRFSVMEEVKRIEALPLSEQEELTPLKTIFLSWAGRGDEETHAKFSKLLRRYFTPHYVETLRPRIQAHLDRLIAEALVRGENRGMDVAKDIAHPLSMTVVAELVGVPADAASIQHYLHSAEDVAAMLEMGTHHQLHRSQRGMLTLCDYLAATVASRRKERKEDLISVFIEADREGTVFSDLYILSQCIMFLVVGYHTTANQLCNGLNALLENPKEREKLLNDWSKLPNAFEEMMRYHGAVASLRRLAEDDVPLGGKVIRKGDTAVCVFAAANRDPEVFPEPDRFDIDRPMANKQIGFAIGQYACLGQALARLEADIFFRTLLGRFPAMRPLEAPRDWKVFRPFGREFESFRVACQ